MTKDQIEQMLGEMGIPFRYHHFTQKEMQDIPLPIVVWLTPGTDNFFADGKTYKKITKLDIELYTDDKDWELEKKLEESWTNMTLPGSRQPLSGWSRRKCGSRYMKWRYRK
jgi:hypothetical protein